MHFFERAASPNWRSKVSSIEALRDGNSGKKTALYLTWTTVAVITQSLDQEYDRAVLNGAGDNDAVLGGDWSDWLLASDLHLQILNKPMRAMKRLIILAKPENGSCETPAARNAFLSLQWFLRTL
jgi:hypothetical protein